MNKDWLEKDFYAILGVSKDSTPDEIKKKYRKLARELHPDKNPGDAKAEERFKQVSEAYDVLSDDAKHKEYDEARSLFANGGYRAGRFGGGPGAGQGAGQYNVNMEDLFGDGNSGFGDFLGGIFNRGRPGRTAQPRRGGDLESELTLSFDDALDGVTVPLRLSTEASCKTCHGTGAKLGTSPGPVRPARVLAKPLVTPVVLLLQSRARSAVVAAYSSMNRVRDAVDRGVA